METKTIKIVLTKVGTAYEPTKEYHLHDYIVIDNVTIYTCKRVDKDTMVCVGHPLTDTAYWDKSVDLSDALTKVTQATNDAITATQEAAKATTNANTAANAAAGAEKVDATLDNDTLSVTDRTGVKKQLKLITNAKALEIEQKVSDLSNYIDSISLLEENDVVRHIFNGKWVDKTKAKHQCISCNKGDVFEITKSLQYPVFYSFLKSYDRYSVGNDIPAPEVDFANGYTDTVISKTDVTIEAPDDAKYLYIEVLQGNTLNTRPTSIKRKLASSIPTIIEQKFDRSNIVQELGDNGNKVMSQKAISEKIGKVDDTIKSLNYREFSLDALSGYVNEEGFISNKTIRLIKANNSFCQPIILTSKAKYVGNSAPTIKFNVGAYNSIPYTIGNINKDIQSWRIPPMLDSMPETVVTITVPEDTKLYVSDFSAKYETSQSRTTLGLRFNSHLGFLMYAPEQTIQSLESASLMGYSGCIINPIKTSDNVWMCYHGGKKYLSTDGTVENAIAIADSEFKNYTYEQIRAFSVVTSNSMNKYFKDCKVPTLDEVLELFAKVGMRPIFSVHPAPTSDDWSEIKNKLFKYNLLKYLTIKVFSVADAESAYKVFGDSIDSYVFIIYETTALNVAKMCNDFRNSTVGNSNCRLSIELGAKDSYTEECFNEVLNKGFYITAESFRDKTPNGDSIKNLIRLGASEFTDDENPHSGLNW